MTERLYVFCYDITSPKTRRRVAKRLEAVAVRVQGSVFEVRMTHEKAQRLGRELDEVIDPGDSLKVYALGRLGLSRSMSFGAALPPADGDYIYV